MSRHLYDLEKLMDTQYGREALADRSLYDAIVEHRRVYYALKLKPLRLKMGRSCWIPSEVLWKRQD